MSIGGGQNKQSQSSSNSSTSQNYGSDIWGTQSPYLADLYSRAQSGADASSPWAVNGQYNYGNNSLNRADASIGQSNDWLTKQGAALGRFLQPGEDPAAAAYAKNMGQQFNEQFLPGLQGDAAVAGGLGGSRQQIGAALGSQRAMQSIGDFTANIYSGQQDRALQAAMGYGDIARGFSTNAAGDQSQAQQRLAMSDFARGMPWYNLSQYAGLLGSPISIDKGGYSTSTGTGSGSGSGWNAKVGIGGG